jgi:putative transposase
VDAPQGRRHGDGKPRRLSVRLGTVTVRRPRGRGLGDRFVSRVRPWFQRWTRAVGALLPQLYWPGLALGDFALAWRGVLGEGAPLSATSLARLKASWQLE